jgi:hypothetical protein
LFLVLTCLRLQLAMINGTAYCRPCFKKLFAEKVWRGRGSFFSDRFITATAHIFIFSLCVSTQGNYDFGGQNPNHKTWEKVNYGIHESRFSVW